MAKQLQKNIRNRKSLRNVCDDLEKNVLTRSESKKLKKSEKPSVLLGKRPLIWNKSQNSTRTNKKNRQEDSHRSLSYYKISPVMKKLKTTSKSVIRSPKSLRISKEKRTNKNKILRNPSLARELDTSNLPPLRQEILDERKNLTRSFLKGLKTIWVMNTKTMSASSCPNNNITQAKKKSVKQGVNGESPRTTPGDVKKANKKIPLIKRNPSIKKDAKSTGRSCKGSYAPTPSKNSRRTVTKALSKELSVISVSTSRSTSRAISKPLSSRSSRVMRRNQDKRLFVYRKKLANRSVSVKRSNYVTKCKKNVELISLTSESGKATSSKRSKSNLQVKDSKMKSEPKKRKSIGVKNIKNKPKKGLSMISTRAMKPSVTKKNKLVNKKKKITREVKYAIVKSSSKKSISRTSSQIKQKKSILKVKNDLQSTHIISNDSLQTPKNNIRNRRDERTSNNSLNKLGLTNLSEERTASVLRPKTMMVIEEIAPINKPTAIDVIESAVQFTRTKKRSVSRSKSPGSAKVSGISAHVRLLKSKSKERCSRSRSRSQPRSTLMMNLEDIPVKNITDTIPTPIYPKERMEIERKKRDEEYKSLFSSSAKRTKRVSVAKSKEDRIDKLIEKCGMSSHKKSIKTKKMLRSRSSTLSKRKSKSVERKIKIQKTLFPDEEEEQRMEQEKKPRKHEISLAGRYTMPLHYEKLYNTLKELDNVLNMMYIQRKISFLKDVKKVYSITYKKKLSIEDLQRIVHVYPESYTLQWEKNENRDNKFELYISFENGNSTPINKNKLFQRKIVLKRNLFDEVREHHNTFLKTIGATDYDYDQNCAWHVKFILSNTPMISLSEIPSKPLTNETNSLKQFLSTETIAKIQNKNVKELLRQISRRTISKSLSKRGSPARAGAPLQNLAKNRESFTDKLISIVKSNEERAKAKNLEDSFGGISLDNHKKEVKHIAQTLKMLYNNEKRSNMFQDAALEHIVQKNRSIILSKNEINSCIDVLCKTCPDWIRQVANPEGLILRINKKISFGTVLQAIA